MDPGSVVLLIPIAAILSGAAVKIAKVHYSAQRPTSLPEDSARLDALEDEVGLLRRELTEAQERLDFTERLLAKSREGKQLG